MDQEKQLQRGQTLAIGQKFPRTPVVIGSAMSFSWEKQQAAAK